MSETVQIVIGIVLLIGVYILTQMMVGLRIKRAARGIVRDLDHLKAYDAATAGILPYAKPNLLRIGLRDFRPKALNALVQGGIVTQTPEGGYYLLKRPEELNF
jgi:hypothetical protein